MSLDILDCIAMACLIVYVSVGLASLDADLRSDTEATTYNGLGMLMLLSVLFTICCGIVIAAMDIFCTTNSSKIEKKVHQALLNVLVAIRDRINQKMEPRAWLDSLANADQLALICNSEHELALLQLLLGQLSDQRLREVFDEIDTDGNGLLDHNELSAALIKLGKGEAAVQVALATLKEAQMDFGHFKLLNSDLKDCNFEPSRLWNAFSPGQSRSGTTTTGREMLNVSSKSLHRSLSKFGYAACSSSKL